jgi:hypothetical protein
MKLQQSVNNTGAGGFASILQATATNENVDILKSASVSNVDIGTADIGDFFPSFAPSYSPTIEAKKSSSGDTLSTGAIVGVVIGCLVLVVAVILFSYYHFQIEDDNPKKVSDITNRHNPSSYAVAVTKETEGYL